MQRVCCTTWVAAESGLSKLRSTPCHPSHETHVPQVYAGLGIRSSPANQARTDASGVSGSVRQ